MAKEVIDAISRAGADMLRRRRAEIDARVPGEASGGADAGETSSLLKDTARAVRHPSRGRAGAR
jgi:hypothetical protein